MKYLKFICFLSVILYMPSCLIENDMSYPRINAEILSFDVEGQVSSTIDQKNHTVSIVLGETAEMTQLRITKFTVTDGASAIEPIAEGDIIDLSDELTVILRIYDETVWTISASQPIARYVKCDNESRDPHIDAAGKTVTIFVNQSQPLESVIFRDMKLEPEGSKIIATYGKAIENGIVVDKNQDCIFPMTLYCVLSRKFIVSYKGAETIWTLNAVQDLVGVEVKSVIPWCHHAEVTGIFNGSGDPHVQYRKASGQNWTECRDITVDGSRISCTVNGLEAGTEYAVRISNGTEDSEEMKFSTGLPEQLANMSFDDWYQDGKFWFPNPDASVKIWDTANKGAGLLGGDLPTVPTDFVAVSGPGKRAARLESRTVVAFFAAGNIYTGEFGRVNGIGAELQWGAPFTGRPKALHGYYAYEPRPIDRVKAPYENMKGEMDQCQILVMLTDWDAPFQVNTNTGTFVDQENDPHIVAYAKYESPENTGGQYREFTLDLEWRRPDATPKYAVVVACASYLGNFFTGGIGSMMYADEFEFIYD